MSKTVKKVLAAALLAVLVLAELFVYLRFAPQGEAGDKTIALEVVHGDGSVKSFKIETDAETLREALEGDGLVSGSESEYGLFVTTVDGESVDEAKNQWWCFSKNGEMLNTGVDDTMISDGEQYEATLSVY